MFNSISIDLTERELQILECISQGDTVREIASHLFLSPHTIITYRRNLLRKLDARNGACLIRKAIEYGILEIRALAS